MDRLDSQGNADFGGGAGRLAQPRHNNSSRTAFLEPAVWTGQAEAASGPEHRQSSDPGDQRLNTPFWFARAGELRKWQDRKHRRQAHRSLQATGPELLQRRRISTRRQFGLTDPDAVSATQLARLQIPPKRRRHRAEFTDRKPILALHSGMDHTLAISGWEVASKWSHGMLYAIAEMKRTRVVTLFFKPMLARVVGLLLVAGEAVATDWPQFRGPHRDGVWDETGILESFPREGLKICWRHPVGGGFSSPVVAEGRVFVLDVELTKPTARERVHCFEEKTGKVLWAYVYEEHYSDWTFVPERGAGPTATPIVEQGRVYTVGANGYVHCLAVNAGTVLWQKNIGQEYRVEEMSCRPSPLIEGALLIVFTGAKPGATVLALDKLTGKEIWKALDDHVSNSSPIAITSGGRRQLIVWTDNSLASLDPANGHTYWREPMVTSNNDSVAMPVFWGNRLLVSGLMLELGGDPPTASFRWPEDRAPAKRILSNTSTAVPQGEYIYSCKSPGELVCLEAAHRQAALEHEQCDQAEERGEHSHHASRWRVLSIYR